MKDRKELEAGAGLIVGTQDTSAVRLCLNRQGKEPGSTVPSGDSLTAPGRGSSFPCLRVSGCCSGKQLPKTSTWGTYSLTCIPGAVLPLPNSFSSSLCSSTLHGVCPPSPSHHWLDTVVCGGQQLWPSSCFYNWQQKTKHHGCVCSGGRCAGVVTHSSHSATLRAGVTTGSWQPYTV